ncbi:MAG: hypothetical protein AMS18_12005 [Gemmatimonas sp. SG8_17]|nr:MAG: hypothetical protein AMS18_12005 [Gemmatimonas sp. SG8_17]
MSDDARLTSGISWRTQGNLSLSYRWRSCAFEDNVYGVTILDETERYITSTVTLGAVNTTLGRLERKGRVQAGWDRPLRRVAGGAGGSGVGAGRCL